VTGEQPDARQATIAFSSSFFHSLDIVSQNQVLARKWRPRIFSQLTGQDHVVRALTNALEQKRLHHAYLFTGTRGIGKTTIARILAKALNCRTGVTSVPCGICTACSEIDEGRFIDLIELDAASNTQVEKMRELLENALYAPTTARYKVYIIDEVHMLSKSAFNAMLKTLEEPPEHVKFILATTDPQKIPVTVLSRCLQFNLKQIPPPLISARLKHVLEEEKISCDPVSLQLLARAAQGSMRDALSILDQAIAFGEGRIEEAGVREMLGAIDQGYLYDLLDALARKDGPGMLAIADAMEVRSLSFDAALQDLATLLHRLALAQIVPSGIGEDNPERERVFGLAAVFPPQDVQLFYQMAILGRSDLSRAPDEYAGFTMTLMRMLAFLPEDMPVAAATPRAPRSSPLSRAQEGWGGAGDGSRSSPLAPATPENVKSAPPAGERARAGAERNPASKRVSVAVPTRTGYTGHTSAVTGTGIADTAGTADVAPVAKPSAMTEAAVERTGTEAGPDFTLDLLSRDWASAISQLKLSGMAKELAQHCEVKDISANEIEFAILKASRHLLAYQDKLKTVLSEYAGRPLRLKFSLGDGTGMTPAEQENREKQEKQSQAIVAIESDPFVRDLVENFDARLIVSSIKPIQ
jgi:DNA polymerase III subunit gamma/tau